jgi:16S rRNA (cytosine967-C5)-methyltransferase
VTVIRQNSVSARGLAFAVLGRILDRRQPLDEAFKSAAAPLSPADLAFARHLVATSLRRLGQIDAILAACLDRPLPESARGTRNALRLGLTQLLFLETPPHAAVSETVDLVRDGRYRGLVNAVLRRVSREGKDLIAGQDAARLDTPDWLWELLAIDYGPETARAVAEAHLAEPPLDIVLRPGQDPGEWAEKLDAGIFPTGVLRRTSGGRVETLPGYDEGAWWIQDAAAALPVRFLDCAAGETVVDLCAAPGGKTAQLAAMGAKVVAVDRSEGRLALLRDTLARLRLDAEVIAADAIKWRPDTPVARILLDAPCSATGTIRRHPDLPHIKTLEDVRAATAVQDRLLTAAAEMLAPGGVLIYCVCSLARIEGEDRIEAHFASGGPLRRRPIRPDELPALAEAVTPEGDVRTLPCHLAAQGGMDGFFIARLEKPA